MLYRIYFDFFSREIWLNKKHISQINRFFNSNLKCFKKFQSNPDLNQLRVKERFFNLPSFLVVGLSGLEGCFALGQKFRLWKWISSPNGFRRKLLPTSQASLNKKKYSLYNCFQLFTDSGLLCMFSFRICWKNLRCFPKVLFSQRSGLKFCGPPKKGLLWKNSFLGCKKNYIRPEKHQMHGRFLLQLFHPSCFGRLEKGKLPISIEQASRRGVHVPSTAMRWLVSDVFTETIHHRLSG